MTVTLIQVGAAILLSFASALVLWAVYLCDAQPLPSSAPSVELEEADPYPLRRAA
jgi:hypothetical protein